MRFKTKCFICDTEFPTNNRYQIYCCAECRFLGTGKKEIKKFRKLSPQTVIKNPLKRTIRHQGAIEIINEGVSQQEIQKSILSKKKQKFYYARNNNPTSD